MNSNELEPLISIVMPNYNKAPFIAEAIESVLSQTWENWELIIVDDASTDSSKSIIEEYKNRESRIHFLSQGSQKKSGTARNVALHKAQGSFIAFLDSDDKWHPEKLKKQIYFMIENNSDISTTHTEIIDLKGKIIGYYKPEKIKPTLNDLLKENILSTSATMINREKCNTITFPDFPLCQDYACWMDLITNGKNVHLITIPYTQHRINPRFYLLTRIPKVFFRWKVYRRHLNHLDTVKFLTFYILTGFKKSQKYRKKQ